MIENRKGRRLVRIFVDGRRRRMGSAATDEDAQALELAAIKQRNAAPAATLSTLAAAWFHRRELDGVSTVDDERARWRIHVEGSSIADVAVELLSPALVEAWIRGLQTKLTSMRHRPAKPLAPKTIREIIGLVRQALDAAGVAPNPVTQLRKVVRAATKRRGEDAAIEPWTYLDQGEQNQLLSSPVVPELERLVVAVAVLTGMRQGEQANLELADVHLDDEAPHIVVRFGGYRRARSGKPAQRMPPKNGKVRRVYLSPEARAVVARWLDLLPTWAPSNPLGLAFPTRGGSRCPTGKHPLWRSEWVPRTATRKGRTIKIDGYTAALVAAGITRHVRWHDLRHTCASSLVAGWWGRRWTLEEVREHLGHTSIASTTRYAHIAESAIKRAVAETTHRSGWASRGAHPEACAGPESNVNALISWVGRPGLEPGANGLKAAFGTGSIHRDSQRIVELGGQVGGQVVAAAYGLAVAGGSLAARARAALAAVDAGEPLAAAMLARLMSDLADVAAYADAAAEAASLVSAGIYFRRRAR